MRMGKGKGSFDHWAARVAVNQLILELKGTVHEQVVRDAFRLAGNKLPGEYILKQIPVVRPKLSRETRPMGVCKERRASSCGHYEIGGWFDVGGSKTAKKEACAFGVGPRAGAHLNIEYNTISKSIAYLYSV
jgi:hypothetical protein